jgi:predicted permease
VWEGGKLFQRFFAVETLLQFLFILVLIPFWKRPSKTKLSLCLFCFSFAALNYLMIGVTIPVLGAIVHYRITAVLFLLMGVLLMTDLEKLNRKFGINKSG